MFACAGGHPLPSHPGKQNKSNLYEEKLLGKNLFFFLNTLKTVWNIGKKYGIKVVVSF